MARFFDDIRHSLQILLRAPRFSMLVVTVLAIGMGSSAAMFSAVHRLVLDSIPYPQPDRLVMLWDRAPDGERQSMTFGSFRELSERSKAFEAMAVMRPWEPALVGESGLQGQHVSADYFRTLGVRPALGAGFDPATDRPNALQSVVISDALWRRRLHADANVLGQVLMLDDRPHTIVGVMPADFFDVLAPSADIWGTLQYDPALPSQGREWGHHLHLVARLGDGGSVLLGQKELAAIAANPTAEFGRPEHAALAKGILVNPLQHELNSAIRPGLYAAFAAALMLLLIACANAANLLSVRAIQRRREIEARVALGAGPRRLLRQSMIESLLLAAGGAALGLGLAQIILRVLSSIAPVGMAGIAEVSITTDTAMLVVAVAMLIGVLIGAMPAMRVLRISRSAGMPRSSDRMIGGDSLARNALVVAEVTIAVVLLIASSLLVRSLQHLYDVDPGFDPAQRLSLNVHVGGPRYDDADTRRFFEEALQAVRQVPGVESAAYTSQIPFRGGVEEYGVMFESTDAAAEPARFGAIRHTVSTGLFEAMGIPISAGRALDDRDRQGAPLAAVISAALAKRHFGEHDAIGKRLRIGAMDGPWYSIVGVAGDVRDTSLTEDLENAFYVSASQWRFADQNISFVIRTRGDPLALTQTVEGAIRAIDPERPITGMATLDSLVAAASADRRFASIWIALFGATALLLAAIGIYGVLSVDINERRSEIGLRMALGAGRSGLVRWVLKSAMLSVLIGCALGVTLAFGAVGLLRNLLFGITETDPASFVAAPLLLAAIALIACLVPLKRALSISPARSMLNE